MNGKQYNIKCLSDGSLIQKEDGTPWHGSFDEAADYMTGLPLGLSAYDVVPATGTLPTDDAETDDEPDDETEEGGFDENDDEECTLGQDLYAKLETELEQTKAPSDRLHLLTLMRDVVVCEYES